jgi:hypothetical protein
MRSPLKKFSQAIMALPAEFTRSDLRPLDGFTNRDQDCLLVLLLANMQIPQQRSRIVA